MTRLDDNYDVMAPAAGCEQFVRRKDYELLAIQSIISPIKLDDEIGSDMTYLYGVRSLLGVSSSATQKWITVPGESACQNWTWEV